MKVQSRVSDKNGLSQNGYGDFGGGDPPTFPPPCAPWWEGPPQRLWWGRPPPTTKAPVGGNPIKHHQNSIGTPSGKHGVRQRGPCRTRSQRLWPQTPASPHPGGRDRGRWTRTAVDGRLIHSLSGPPTSWPFDANAPGTSARVDSLWDCMVDGIKAPYNPRGIV